MRSARDVEQRQFCGSLMSKIAVVESGQNLQSGTVGIIGVEDFVDGGQHGARGSGGRKRVRVPS